MRTGARYSNQFLAIPKSKVFRPHCGTAWPSIKGVMHAVVDGEDGGTPYAQIDDKGRYKVRFPFDMGDAGDGGASRWVRKSEAYAGPSQGMHFPLLKGAEVLVVFLDGDPDRPIISGAVFNEQNTSVVHQHNHTTNQIITPIGNTLTIDDTQGAPQITMFTEAEKNKLFLDGTSGSEKITLNSTVSSAYLRLGTADGESGGEHLTGANGVFLSCGDDVNIKAGAMMGLHSGANFNQAVLGNSVIHIHGTKEEKVDGKSKWTVAGASAAYNFGDWFFFNAAAKVQVSVGATAIASIGAELKVAYAVSASITRGDGFATTFGKMLKIDKSSTTELTLAGRKFVTVLDKKVTSKAGNVEIEATAGQVKIKAATKISLECGGSKIELTPAGIKIQKGGSRQTMNDSLARLKAASIEMKASGAFTAKGATAKIN
jgi:type VI secretion system secreted protein VgrG